MCLRIPRLLYWTKADAWRERVWRGLEGAGEERARVSAAPKEGFGHFDWTGSQMLLFFRGVWGL